MSMDQTSLAQNYSGPKIFGPYVKQPNPPARQFSQFSLDQVKSGQIGITALLVNYSKYIQNPSIMLFHPTKVLLMDFEILFNIIRGH